MSVNLPQCPNCGATVDRDQSGQLWCVACRWHQPDPKERDKGGRPTLYSEGLADEICRRIADGETLSGICKDDDKPTKTTVYAWLREPEKKRFSDRYAQARMDQADAWGDEIVDNARAATRENVPVAALQNDTLKWLMARRSPSKYSERRVNEHTGADGGPIKTEQVPPMPSELLNKLDEHKAGLANHSDDTTSQSAAPVSDDPK